MTIATTTELIPSIQASTDITLKARAARIKASFGLPRWVTRHFSKAQLTNIQVNTQPVISVTATPPLPKSPVEFLARTSDNIAHRENLIAHVQVAELSKPVTKTVKSKILNFLEHGPATGTQIAAALHPTPHKTVTSRISELYRSKDIVITGNVDGVSIYALAEAE